VRGCWASIGSCSQRFAWLVLLIALGVVVPFIIVLPSFNYVEGVLPMMPRGEDATVAFVTLQQSFGVGTIFPNTLLITTEPGTDIESEEWLFAACGALRKMADDVTAALAEETVDYAMTAKDFSGVMMQQGQCTNVLLPLLIDFAPQLGSYLAGTYVKGDATKVQVALKLNPFTDDGKKWISAMRDAMDHATSFNGTKVGQMHLGGIGPTQMDGAAQTFASFPLMVGVTLIIVCVVIGLAFRSIMVPVRAVVCIIWMLAIVFGAAVFIYQNGALNWLGLAAFQPQGGALFWMSPCIAFSIVVGLGLDYDVFFTESVIEAYDKGASAKEAVVSALAHTGNIICAAGVIMAIAFGALLFGSSALNQIAFLLCFGVLIDCFITTKFIIPAICALLSTKANFWPRKRAPAH